MSVGAGSMVGLTVVIAFAVSLPHFTCTLFARIASIALHRLPSPRLPYTSTPSPQDDPSVKQVVSKLVAKKALNGSSSRLLATLKALREIATSFPDKFAPHAAKVRFTCTSPPRRHATTSPPRRLAASPPHHPATPPTPLHPAAVQVRAFVIDEVVHADELIRATDSAKGKGKGRGSRGSGGGGWSSMSQDCLCLCAALKLLTSHVAPLTLKARATGTDDDDFAERSLETDAEADADSDAEGDDASVRAAAEAKRIKAVGFEWACAEAVSVPVPSGGPSILVRIWGTGRRQRTYDRQPIIPQRHALRSTRRVPRAAQHPPIHPSIHASMHPSMHPSIHPTTHPTTRLSPYCRCSTCCSTCSKVAQRRAVAAVCHPPSAPMSVAWRDARSSSSCTTDLLVHTSARSGGTCWGGSCRTRRRR